jgi:hypothetical protein
VATAHATGSTLPIAMGNARSRTAATLPAALASIDGDRQ